jgi:hypothetical protein
VGGTPDDGGDEPIDPWDPRWQGPLEEGHAPIGGAPEDDAPLDAWDPRWEGPEEQFHGQGAVPGGFGFAGGMRSRRVAKAFAVYVLVAATLLLGMGAIIFIQRGEWVPVVLLGVLEVAFIFAFRVLYKLAQKRRPSP